MFYFPLLMLFVHSAWISVWGFKIWKSYFRTMGGTKRRNFKNQLICAWSIKNKVFKKKIYHNLPLLNQQQKACFQQARRQKGLIQQRGLKCPTPMPASICTLLSTTPTFITSSPLTLTIILRAYFDFFFHWKKTCFWMRWLRI